MRRSFAQFLLLSMVGATALVSQSKAPPAKLVFPAKNGGIVFDHTAHAKREKNDCKTCHSSLFAQDSKAPLAFKPPHKNAEDKKTVLRRLSSYRWHRLRNEGELYERQVPYQARNQEGIVL